MKLAIFDVDGTLTDTNEIDNRSYVRAVADELGREMTDFDWADYACVTDSGITNDVFHGAHRLPELRRGLARIARGAGAAVTVQRRTTLAPAGRRSRPPRLMRTQRLLLRVPQLGDAEAIFDGFASDPEATRYLPWRPARYLEETRAQVRRHVAMWRRGDRYPWVIQHDEHGVIGMIEIRLRGHAAEVGFVLSRRHWGWGYTTEVLQVVVLEAFALPGIYRVWATCDVDNLASARVLEKVGMVREGILRRSVIHPNIDEAPRDALCYSKVR